MVTAGLITYTDKGAIQLTDRAQTIVYHKLYNEDTHYSEIPFFKPDDRVIVYGRKGGYVFRSIDNVPAPNIRCGLELFNGNGKLMYSSGHISLIYVAEYIVDTNNSVITFNGDKNRKYGYYIVSKLVTHYIANVRKYQGGPPDWDDYYTFDEYEIYIDVEIFDGGLRTYKKDEYLWSREEVVIPDFENNNLKFNFIVVDITELES